jgi:lysyl-tRNA synthetase class I
MPFETSLAKEPETTAAAAADTAERAWVDRIRSGDRPAFEALYHSFIGKQNGPRAAWLLTTLDPAFVKQRMTEAARAT